jgi:ABC-2 type transport system permease protein
VIGFLFNLTLRQQLFRKSTILLVLLSVLPVLIALIFRLGDSDEIPQEWTAKALYRGLIITAVLPLTALMFGTSAIGDELEDGTAIYLLTKPIERWQILLPKILAPWLLTAVIVVVSVIVSGIVAIDGGSRDIIFGAAVAITIGSLAYTVIFVLFSVLTNHALIAGLVYVFVWEGAIAGIFEGVRYLSIRHYTIGLADWASGKVPDTFDAYVGGGTALVLLVTVTLCAAMWANSRLKLAEIRERP